MISLLAAILFRFAVLLESISRRAAKERAAAEARPTPPTPPPSPAQPITDPWGELVSRTMGEVFSAASAVEAAARHVHDSRGRLFFQPGPGREV